MPHPPSDTCWVIRLLLTPLRKEASSREIDLSMVSNIYDFEKEKEVTEINAYQEIETSTRRTTRSDSIDMTRVLGAPASSGTIIFSFYRILIH